MNTAPTPIRLALNAGPEAKPTPRQRRSRPGVPTAVRAWLKHGAKLPKLALFLAFLVPVGTATAQSTSSMFFIEAEDFDFDGAQHLAEADAMPYLGGAYSGKSALAEIDFHDPEANENAEYRPATQGVAMYASGDLYRDGYDARATFRVAWNHAGDWYNYTRQFPLPAREYLIYARLASGASANAVRLDEVIAGHGTTNQQLTAWGTARGPASGGWDYFFHVPVLDAAGQPMKVRLGGSHTIRLTNLDGGSQDINYLQFVPVDPAPTGACVPAPADVASRWTGDGHAMDLSGAHHGVLRGGVTFGSGRVGEAFLLDGADDYVDTTLDVQPRTLPTTTWEGWVFPIRAGGRQQILSADDGGYDRSVLVEGTRFGIFTGWGVWTPVSISFNRWQHFAVVFSPTNVAFYKDGERFSYDAAPAGQDSLNRLQIGRNPGFGEYFQGRLDEVSVHARALSSLEIRAIVAAGGAGQCRASEPCPAIGIGPAPLPLADTLAAYEVTLTAAGGVGPHTFALATGGLPPGFSLSTSGVLAGTTEKAGIATFTVRVTDAQSCSSAVPLTLTVRESVVVCWPSPAGMADWWRAEGDGLDTAGTNHATLRNGASFAPGRVGQGFLLDGTDDHVEAPAGDLALGTGDFSVEGWAQSSRAKDLATLFSFGPWEPGLYVRANGSYAFYHGNYRGGGTNLTFNDGRFHHFAAVRREGVLSLYQDGRLAGTLPFPEAIQRTTFLIGWDTYPGDHFAGVIDEVSVHRRALTSDEVWALYAAGSAGKCVPGGGDPNAEPPRIAELQPTNGPPGSVVTVRGAGFSAAKSGNQVSFGDRAATVVTSRPHELSVIAPASLPPGEARVVVRVDGVESGASPFFVTTSEVVTLGMNRLSDGLVLSWPTEPSAYELESSPRLGLEGRWTRWSGTAEVIAAQKRVFVSPGVGTQFFRLARADAPAGPASAVSTGRGLVLAATGGTVTTADRSATLEVPPGALAEDTEIEITAVLHPAGEGRTAAGEVFFAPDGLRFGRPAQLKIQTPGDAPAGHRPTLHLVSGAHPAVEVGSEISRLQAITNLVFDPARRQLVAALLHFSAGYWSWSKDLYAILDIPGRFLKKGDLLFVLTGATEGQGGDWMPGHCGLYLGTRSPTSTDNDGLTIIESTQTRKLVLGEVRFDKLSTGLPDFLNLGGTHISMGARRPSHFDLTDDQRARLGAWAISKIGQRYLIIGGGAFLASDDSLVDGYTCVGLTELAYEFGAGRRIVPSQSSRMFFTPFRQFQWTVPVNTAEIKVGEDFDCKVTGIVNFGTPASNDYYTDPRHYTRSLDLDACDEDARRAVDARRAKFEPTFGQFTFTPDDTDGGKDFQFAFKIDATQSRAGIERTAMIVQVHPRGAVTYVRQDPPVIRISTFQGTGSPTNLVVTDREAFTRGPDGSPLRISWDPPPARIVAGSSFTIDLRADAGTNPAETSASITAPPRLMAEVGQFPGEFDPLTAFVGYEFIRNCNSPFGSSCYRRVTRPGGKTTTLPPDASEAVDFRGVTIEFRAFRSFGPFNPGEIRATLEWNYLPGG